MRRDAPSSAVARDETPRAVPVQDETLRAFPVQDEIRAAEPYAPLVQVAIRHAARLLRVFPVLVEIPSSVSPQEPVATPSSRSVQAEILSSVPPWDATLSAMELSLSPCAAIRYASCEATHCER